MERVIFACGALLAGLGVAFGAFGAHALKARVGPELLAVFETGVRYQLYHGLGLLACVGGVTLARPPARAAAWLLGLGTVVFSGSLYVLALTGVRAFGAVTPVGGVALIAGWGFIAWRLTVRDPSGSG
jgi:uncharacterized membrane protein YgdD (TMEM256/DUF423 family)